MSPSWEEIISTWQDKQTPGGAGQTERTGAMKYLSLLAGWRFSSCFRLLLPGVAACGFRPQPPLCLLLPCSLSLLSASFSHIWQHVQSQQTCQHFAAYLCCRLCTNMVHLQYKPGFSLVLHPVFGEPASLLPVEAPNCQHHPSEDFVHIPPSSSAEHPCRQRYVQLHFINIAATPTAEGREA